MVANILFPILKTLHGFQRNSIKQFKDNWKKQLDQEENICKQSKTDTLLDGTMLGAIYTRKVEFNRNQSSEECDERKKETQFQSFFWKKCKIISI